MPPDPRALARRRGIKRQRQLDEDALHSRVQAIGRTLRRQVSTEAAVKSRRTLDRVRAREATNAFEAWLLRRHALGEFG